MPNRFLKESICTSENIDQLKPMEEIFFYRLIVNCDDYGRMDARPKLLASKLFPLKEITLDEIRSFLKALVTADLISLYEVDGHPYLQMKTWSKHQQTRATKSKYPDPVDEQMISTDNNCYQEESTDNKCPRIRNTYSNNDIRNTITDTARACARVTAAADDDVNRINREHIRLLDAAENAGFQKSNSVRERLIALYADHGLEKMLAGIASCVQHGVSNLAYLEGCLSDRPKKKDKVPAQDYAQRDYSGEQDAAMERLMQWHDRKEANGA